MRGSDPRWDGSAEIARNEYKPFMGPPIDGHSDPDRDNKPLWHREMEKIQKIVGC